MVTSEKNTLFNEITAEHAASISGGRTVYKGQKVLEDGTVHKWKYVDKDDDGKWDKMKDSWK
jgi:hypothetical protein